MKKLRILAIPLMAVSLLASCDNGGEDKPEPTEYTLTLTLDNCNVDGKSVYSKKYSEGSTIESVTVAPDNNFVLRDDSIEASYRQYWKESTDGTYVLSGLIMNRDYNITITAITPPPYIEYTITYKNISSEEASGFTEIYTSEDLPLTLSTPTRTDWTFGGYYTDQTFSESSKLTNNTIPVGTEGNLTLYAKMIYKEKSLDNLSWTDIKMISEKGGARATFGNPDGTQTKQLKLIGQNFEHTVRIIGFDQDKDENENTLGITFEFANLLSDNNGYSLACRGNLYGGYSGSAVRNNLVGQNEVQWYEKEANYTSTTYKQSVLKMLPEELVEVITPASKGVFIKENDTWKEQTICDKLFVLNPKEIGFESEAAEKNVPIYEYYADCDTVDATPKRIKKQYKGADGAVTSPSTIYEGSPYGYNYAGYNSKNEGNGGVWWLRSPYKNNGQFAWTVTSGGGLEHDYPSSYYARALSPAFCI